MSDESPIIFTDSCCAKVADLIAEENNPDLKLRDYTEGLQGSQFVIRSNPNAVTTCGCGSSFSV